MVRLEEDKPKAAPKATVEFQFQNGTIRSLLSGVLARLPKLFQFQNGTIRSGIDCGVNTGFAVISIPKWYD